MAVRGGRDTEEQFIEIAAQHFDEATDMIFIDPATPGLDVGHDLTGHICLGDLQSGGQLLLRQPSAQAELGQVRADVIGPAFHVTPRFFWLADQLEVLFLVKTGEVAGDWRRAF